MNLLKKKNDRERDRDRERERKRVRKERKENGIEVGHKYLQSVSRIWAN